MNDGEREDAEIRRRSEVMARALEHGGLGRPRDKPDEAEPDAGSKSGRGDR